MVRTGPIKVRRFSKSVAASTFDFLQKNAENRLFAVESRVKPPLINTPMSDGFQTTKEVFRHLYWSRGWAGSVYSGRPMYLGKWRAQKQLNQILEGDFLLMMQLAAHLVKFRVFTVSQDGTATFERSTLGEGAKIIDMGLVAMRGVGKGSHFFYLEIVPEGAGGDEADTMSD